MIDYAAPGHRLRLLSEVTFAVLADAGAAHREMQDVGVSDVHPLHRKLEVRRMAPRHPQYPLIPVAGRLEIGRLDQEMLEVAERHVRPPGR